MAETKKSAKAKPIADVAHPGKSAPADNSRSIVISRPIMQDPMMVDDTVAKTASVPALASAKISRELTLEPTADLPEPAQAEEKAERIETKTETKPPASDASATDAPKEPDESDTKPETDEPEADSKTDEKTVPQAQADLESEQAKQAEHEAMIQKIIDSKQYFLPINTVEKRRSARFVALGVILAVLLGVAWLNIALDAGIIHLGGLKAVTHIF